MDYLERIKVADVKAYATFSEVPIGAIVQTFLPNEALIVGMKTSLTLGNGDLPALLVLSGPACGELVHWEYVRGTCVDIGLLVDILAVDAGKTTPGLRSVAQGSLHEHDDRIFMWGVMTLNERQTQGYFVCIASGNVANVGASIVGLRSRVEVAPAADIAEKRAD